MNPSASFFTSFAGVILKSPLILCAIQDAATENFKASFGESLESCKEKIKAAAKESPAPSLSIILVISYGAYAPSF